MLRPRMTVLVASTGLALSGLVFGAMPAHSATTYTFTGESSSDWSDDGNWQPVGVPNSATDNAIIPRDQLVYVDQAVTLGDLRMEGDAQVYNGGGGSLTTSSFTFVGGILSMKVVTGTFTSSGESNKEVTGLGSIDATSATVESGELEISGTGDQFKVKSVLRIGGRVTGTGGDARINIAETGCTSPTACGIVVIPGDAYGAAIESLDLIVSKINFDPLSPRAGDSEEGALSLRGGTWTPKGPVTISGGTVETGGGYPAGYDGYTDEEVRLPTTVLLNDAGWTHTSGEVVANTTVTPGATGASEFTWQGGTIIGKFTIAKAGTAAIATTLGDTQEVDLYLRDPSKAGSTLSLDGDVRMLTGASLSMDPVSVLESKGTFVQEAGSVISGSSGKVTRVANAGTWRPLRDDLLGEESASIDGIPFISTGTLDMASGLLRLSGNASSLSGKTLVSVDDAEVFGSIQLDDEATLKLGGSLAITTSPSAGLESGDDLLVVDNSKGSPGNLSGDFSPVTGTQITPTVGYRAALVEDGYSLTVGAVEEVTLTAKSATKVKAKKPLAITYTVTNRAPGAVEPVLQLPRIKGARVETPDELECEETNVIACVLPEMEPGATETVEVFYTFAKTGKPVIKSTVITAGFNPRPAAATSIIRVTVTR